MDLEQLIAELRCELEMLNGAILSLEWQGRGLNFVPRVTPRRSRVPERRKDQHCQRPRQPYVIAIDPIAE